MSFDSVTIVVFLHRNEIFGQKIVLALVSKNNLKKIISMKFMNKKYIDHISMKRVWAGSVVIWDDPSKFG